MDNKYYGVPIPKTDVLMEDLSNMNELIRVFTSDREKLLSVRNTWDVFFMGYDDDPREIPDIPEVVDWIEQSVEAGIPWFYFMSPKSPSSGLLTFMICCGAGHDPKRPERYIFDRDKILPFIKKNLDNLATFAEEHNIPDDISCAATDEIMEFIQNVLHGSIDAKQTSDTAKKDKQFQEALVRLSMLAELHNLNPNVKQYFENGKLYYSYTTGGGYIGSIDTINYDERYATIVKAFEEQTSYLVYHVIERGKTIAILFVGDNYNRWMDERPMNAGIMAWVFDVETNENELGYIQIDNLQGALYRRNDTVYSSMPSKDAQIQGLSNIDSEVVERLEILKNAGIITDLDISMVYVQEGEICCSILQSILGTPVGVINRISVKTAYVQLLKLLSNQISKKLYFLMGSNGHKLAFLSISEDSVDWENEKLALEKGRPYAVVVNLQDMTAKVEQIKYEMVNGGPIFICD